MLLSEAVHALSGAVHALSEAVNAIKRQNAFHNAFTILASVRDSPCGSRKRLMRNKFRPCSMKRQFMLELPLEKKKAVHGIGFKPYQGRQFISENCSKP